MHTHKCPALSEAKLSELDDLVYFHIHIAYVQVQQLGCEVNEVAESLDKLKLN